MPTEKTTASKRFRVGDRVKFRWGGTEWYGTIMEDRGFLGVDGEQIVRVRALFDVGLERDAEVRASRLVEVPAAGYLVFENKNYRIYLDYLSPAAEYPQPSMRIEQKSGDAGGLPDMSPTDTVAANIIMDLFRENKQMLACEIAIRLFTDYRQVWDDDTRNAVELFMGKDNVENLTIPH